MEKLNKLDDCRVFAVSSFIETEPYGGVEQDKFLNGCIGIKTLETPQELLRTVNRIEAEEGRERLVHWGPRTLDIDILLYDDERIFTENLKIPHPDMHNRMFVLEPLNEIAPFVIHPVLLKSVMRMKEKLIEKEKVENNMQ